MLLFAGQGGVGRTTAAAATAVLAARSAKVLLVSSGALGVPAGPDPVPVGELQVLHVDMRASFEARWPGSATELALPPGAAELLTLLETRDRALAGNWDAVLLDGPPLDALLSLGSLAGTVERLWPEHTRVVHRSPFTDVVGSLQAALAVAGDLLAAASVRLVIDPSPAGVDATRAALTALALHGYAVDSLIANRLLPPEAGRSAWARSVRAGQDDALATLDVDVPVRRAPYLAAAPVEPAALLALGEAVYGPDDPLAPGPAGVEPAVTPAGSGYELTVPLPYVRGSQVRLARSGDELVLTVGDQLRRLVLPPVLRRCIAVGASAGDGAVRVRFRPDPALWPREGDR
ncbi:MAG TPA: ArsA-related P-loop ATPase [Mycobacteriales bacterium]